MDAASTTGTIAERLGAWAAALSLEQVPTDAAHAARRCILDTVGVIIAGSRTPTGERVQAHMDANYADGACTVLGPGTTASPAGAALANGVAGHVLDFDDTSYAGIIHGSCIVLPAVLAAVEQGRRDGRTFLEAFTAGAEAAYAVGLTVTDSHYFKGWWATGTCGMVGAAAGAARALGLDAAQTTHAIGLAAVQACGMVAFLGTDAKPFMAGRCAMIGLEAALLAEHGLTAPANAFEDRRGFLQLLNDGGSDEAGLGELGESWRLVTPGIFFKRYPICSAAHAGAEMTERLVGEAGLTVDDITQVVCEVPHLVAISLVHDDPSRPTEAQFSMPFAIGAVLAFGTLGPEHLNGDCLQDASLRAAMGKVVMRAADDLDTPEMKSRYPESARVTIKTTDGRELSGFLGAPTGMPENPATDGALGDKFRRCLSFAGWPDARADALQAALWEIENAPDVSALLREDRS
ncbi:MAG: MmgE/PrpD family protein [Methyloligellaceae bacterium]